MGPGKTVDVLVTKLFGCFKGLVLRGAPKNPAVPRTRLESTSSDCIDFFFFFKLI